MGLWNKLKSAAAGAALGIRASFGGYYDATWPTTDRQNVLFYFPNDSRQIADSWTRWEIRRKVEWLFQNFGIVKEGCRGIARGTVGKGVGLQINSEDEEWNELAEADFETYAMAADRCDRSGRRNFFEAQFFAVFQRVKVGEFWAAIVPNPRWGDEPCFQLWDVQEVDTPGDQKDNKNIVDGVEMDESHCPVGYWVRTLGGTFSRIDAAQMCHWFFADETNQCRGVSEFAAAVAPFMDAKEAINITTKTAKQNSAIGLHIKKLAKMGGRGALDTIRSLNQRGNVQQGNPPGAPNSSPSNDPDPAYERLVGGGAIIYTDENGDAKFLTPQSPNPLLEPFISKVLLRNGFASLGIPGEYFWDLSDLNASSVRLVSVKAEQTFDYLGDGLIGRFCTPLAVSYLLHRISIGKLRACSDENWMTKLEWQRPARASVDVGRDGALEISQLAAGVTTMSDSYDKRGLSWRKQIRQWFLEWKYAKSVADLLGVDWALPNWRAGQPGQAGSVAPGADDQDKGKPSQDDPQKSGKGQKKDATEEDAD